MNTPNWDAVEMQSDATFSSSTYAFERHGNGWTVMRNGTAFLELGTGYRALQTRSCGICSTDLARPFLPFPLPQVIGHEVLAEDEQGRRYVIDINASCVARGLDSRCDHCRAGMPSHCRERLTLGINGLPGGFGDRVLVPEHGTLEVPDVLSDDAAVLMEPFAAS